MALTFKCSACGQDVTVRYLKVGEEVECPGCGNHGVVPPDAKPVDADDSPHGIHPGEYIPPVPLEAGQEAPDQPQYLASRWKRFWGYMIDSTLVAIPLGALGFLSDGSVHLTDYTTKHQLFLKWLETPWATAAVFVIFAVGAFQAFLLITRGQTVGKWILGTRIVTMGYRHPSWWRLVLVRPLIVLIASYRPHIQWTDAEWGFFLRLVFSGLGMVNALFVFNSDRRALHDHLAGTQVVDIRLMRISDPLSNS